MKNTTEIVGVIPWRLGGMLYRSDLQVHYSLCSSLGTSYSFIILRALPPSFLTYPASSVFFSSILLGRICRRTFKPS